MPRKELGSQNFPITLMLSSSYPALLLPFLHYIFLHFSYLIFIIQLICIRDKLIGAKKTIVFKKKYDICNTCNCVLFPKNNAFFCINSLI